MIVLSSGPKKGFSVPNSALKQCVVENNFA